MLVQWLVRYCSLWRLYLSLHRRVEPNGCHIHDCQVGVEIERPGESCSVSPHERQLHESPSPIHDTRTVQIQNADKTMTKPRKRAFIRGDAAWSDSLGVHCQPTKWYDRMLGYSCQSTRQEIDSRMRRRPYRLVLPFLIDVREQVPKAIQNNFVVPCSSWQR